MRVCPFWSFLNSSPALGSCSESPSAPLIYIHRKVQQAKGCCHRTVTQSSGCFLALNQIKGGLFAQQFVEIHRLYFLRVVLDASKMKLVALSGSWKGLDSHSGRVEIWSRKYSCVYLCVFVSFPRIHTNAGKTDVLPCFIASCPRREESHLLEELCCWCTMTLNIYRSIHLLPVLTILLCYIKPT